MGYNLKPINKKEPEIVMGAFIWTIILEETGMGYVLGYGKGIDPGTYIYQQGNKGSPASNDGYKVSSKEAKMMAIVARGYISVQEFVNKQWSELPEEKRAWKKESLEKGENYYRREVGVEFLDKIKQFCDFAEKSKGFRIY